MRKKFFPILVIFLSVGLLAGLLFTWPLAQNFFTSIPYTLRPIPGFEKIPLMPGDHLQTYYWFWLLSDNLFGNSSLFTNPYEFNGPLGPMSSVYANFPFSLLYILLLPLGSIGAYNGLIFLSFILSGLGMFLLTRTWTKDHWASILAGLIFAVFPYRVSHIAGGQLYGYVIFLLPLCLYFIEQTLITGRWVYGWASGLTLVLMSLMDPHTSYLTVLTVGIYLPSRLFLIRPFPIAQGLGKQSLWPGLIGVLSGGLAFSGFLWIGFGKGGGIPFWPWGLCQSLILGLLCLFLSWFFLSALLAQVTILSFIEARCLVGKGFFLLTPLFLYAIKYRLKIPYLGLTLSLLCFGSFLIFWVVQWIKKRGRLLTFNRSSIFPIAVGLGLGLVVASAYLIHMKNTVFLPSLAGKGRTINEVLLFSPKVSNFFFWQDINYERYVFLGWGLVLLAALGMIPLLRGNPYHFGKRALAGLLAFLALVLTLGPTLTCFPLYRFLYHHFPFFNYPRVSARFVMVGLIFLCLLAGITLAGLREWLGSRGLIGAKRWLSLLIILMVTAEYHTYQPLGLSLMNGSSRIYQDIRDRLPKGRMVLELPIWPGDSHQSSAYEYTVTRTGKPMINGYAPVVFRDYIREVFWPLYPLDFGELRSQQREKLNKLKVDLVTFHDNSMMYTDKVSPFPPRLALKRLRASSDLDFLIQDRDQFLFKVKPEDTPEPDQSVDRGVSPTPTLSLRGRMADGGVAVITSPVAAVFFVNNLPKETGKYEFDSSASGYNLLMDEQGLIDGKLIPRPGVWGNVLSALSGRDRPGYLTLGGNRFFPAGKYRARFRIKAGSSDRSIEIGRVEIIEEKTKTVARKTLRGGDLNAPGDWTDVPLDFEISQAREIGFRVFFSGKTPLSLNLVIIGFADQDSGLGSVEAEDLLRQTGTVVSDHLASSKEAVYGQAGFHPPIYLCHGPYRTFEPGWYRAQFYLRLKERPVLPKESEVVLLEVATDMGKRVFTNRMVRIQDLRVDQYRPIEVDFEVPFRCELDYRVKFLGRADLLVDRVSVVDLNHRRGN